MKKLLITLTASLVFIGPAVYAATLRASCYLQDGEGKTIQGLNVDKRYEIASVSKVMTAYWAARVFGLEARFPTLIRVTPVSTNLVDVHFQGSRDPYLGREALQMIAADLNRNGYTRVRNLTFDEKFRFLGDVRGGRAAQGHFQLNDPTDARVESELRIVLKSLKANLGLLQRKVKTVMGMNLPSSLTLSVQKVEFKAADSVVLTPETKTFVYRSAPLRSLLKEMNRNSNNYAAHQIFESLGGAAAFQKFIKADLGLEEKDIRFVNGSGDRLDIAGGKPEYNQATCRSIIKVVKALELEARRQQSGIEDLMAVAGSDVSGEESSVSNLYDSDTTSGALVAKTGTVSPMITLAGMVSTQQGDVYFGYLVGTNGAVSDWREARTMIRTQVTRLFGQFKGKAELDYTAHVFLPFDLNSTLEKVETQTASLK